MQTNMLEEPKGIFKIGDTVQKKSNKPFKSKLTQEIIISFDINTIDPKRRVCAVFADGSVCNLSQMFVV